MRKQEKKHKIIVNKIIKHIEVNKKQYLIISILFLIGIIIGVTFINNINQEDKSIINTYLKDFTNEIKNDYQIDQISLLKNTIVNYMFISIIIWFMGSTVIGIPIVYLIVVFKGFALGYTLSCILISFGTIKGIFFSIISMLLQNLIAIPAIFALSVSGIKLYKSIIQDKRKENIKIEIIRHTIFSLFITFFLVMSAFIETYISTNLLNWYVKMI